jgi:hypothetical protein
MNGMRDWVKLPNVWIEDGGLRDFQWKRGRGANELAALMVLAVIGHHADPEEGIAQLTYDHLQWKAALSRAKIAAGLKILGEREIVEPRPKGRGSYRLAGYDPHKGWAKLPARGLYRNGSVAAFDHFNLRRPAKLNALKLYFLFASRRDRKTNMAKISYEKIEEFAGVPRNRIREALSVLAANGLVHIEHAASQIYEHGVANAYRLAHLDGSRHMGTTGRRLEGLEDVGAFEDA